MACRVWVGVGILGLITLPACFLWEQSGIDEDATPATSRVATDECTWSGAPTYGGSGSFTWYYFGQGTSQSNGEYKTACGYTGTESGQTDTVTNIANGGLASDTYFAAIPGANGFDTVGRCGMCVEIINGERKIIATVIDECPTDNGQNPLCAQAGHLDLSYAAWQALGFSVGDPSGTTWAAVECPVTGNIVASLNAQGQVYFQNIAFPVGGVTSGGSQATQSQYGYWSNVSSGQVTLTDILGDTVTGDVPANGGDIGVQFPTAPAACTLDGG
ncbi:MAG: RlpA-like double-psi beta-barrel domain-containing protein [Polyangiaceae bacterium]